MSSGHSRAHYHYDRHHGRSRRDRHDDYASESRGDDDWDRRRGRDRYESRDREGYRESSRGGSSRGSVRRHRGRGRSRSSSRSDSSHPSMRHRSRSRHEGSRRRRHRSSSRDGYCNRRSRSRGRDRNRRSERYYDDAYDREYESSKRRRRSPSDNRRHRREREMRHRDRRSQERDSIERRQPSNSRRRSASRSRSRDTRRDSSRRDDRSDYAHRDQYRSEREGYMERHHQSHHSRYHHREQRVPVVSYSWSNNRDRSKGQKIESNRYHQGADGRDQPPNPRLGNSSRGSLPVMNGTFLNMKGCQQTQHVVCLVYKNRARLSHQNLSAMWSRIPQLLRNDNGVTSSGVERGEISELRQQLEEILKLTIDDVEYFTPRDLTESILGMAKIVNILHTARNDGGRTLFQGLLVECSDDGGVEPKHELFQNFAAAAVKLLPRCNDARRLPNLAYAYGLVGYLPTFDDGKTLFDEIAPHAIKLVNGFDQQGYANLLWSYAKIGAGASNSTLFEKVAETVIGEGLGSFYSQGIANIMWAHATAGISDSNLFEKAADAAIERGLGKFKSQELTSMLWSYATVRKGGNDCRLLGKCTSRLFTEADTYLRTKADLGTLQPQHLSNTLWAFATVKSVDKNMADPIRLFERLEIAILEIDMARFKPQELSNTVWAYSTVGVANSGIYKKVADSVQSRDLRTFNDQNLSNLVWSYASARQSCPGMYSKISDYICAYGLQTFSQQHLSNLAYAYAKAEMHDAALFHKIEETLAQRDLHSYKTQHLSNIAWAFATAKIPCRTELFEKIADAVVARSDEFNAQELSNLLWSFAVTGRVNAELFSSLSPNITRLIKEWKEKSFNFQEISNIAWSFSVADIPTPSLFDGSFVKFVLDQKKNDDRNSSEGQRQQGYNQLHQFQLWQKELNSGVNFPSGIQRQFYEMFISSDFRPSSFQTDIVDVLSAIGLEPKEEVLTPSGYRLDALVEVDGKKIGVEADGPSHFIEKEPVGKTIIKRRQVRSIDGIRIVSVPYWDWRDLGDCPGRTSTKKQEYMSSILGMK